MHILLYVNYPTKSRRRKNTYKAAFFIKKWCLFKTMNKSPKTLNYSQSYHINSLINFFPVFWPGLDSPAPRPHLFSPLSLFTSLFLCPFLTYLMLGFDWSSKFGNNCFWEKRISKGHFLFIYEVTSMADSLHIKKSYHKHTS